MAPDFSIKIPAGRYPLLQFHFHFGSEHAVNSTRTELEAHFTRMSNRGQ